MFYDLTWLLRVSVTEAALGMSPPPPSPPPPPAVVGDVDVVVAVVFWSFAVVAIAVGFTRAVTTETVTKSSKRETQQSCEKREKCGSLSWASYGANK